MPILTEDRIAMNKDIDYQKKEVMRQIEETLNSIDVLCQDYHDEIFDMEISFGNEDWDIDVMRHNLTNLDEIRNRLVLL